MTVTPRLSMGLPVRNGEPHITQSIEALLGQSYSDFELIITDNASTDATEEICRGYAKGDSRIRYYRHAANIGIGPNQNFSVHQARGELFKWASADDLYARTLIESCVAALDEYPDVVLAHSWTAKIDLSGELIKVFEYALSTSSPHAPERFRSILFDRGGDDDYGVIRLDALRRTGLQGSHHHADHTLIAELALLGRFYHVPDWLYFRRVHPGQNGKTTMRKRCVNLDPQRASRLRHPAVRLYGEYLWGYVAAIQGAPMSAKDRLECYAHLLRWFSGRARGKVTAEPDAIEPPAPISVRDVVAGLNVQPAELRGHASPDPGCTTSGAGLVQAGSTPCTAGPCRFSRSAVCSCFHHTTAPTHVATAAPQTVPKAPSK
jgi:glycosyltransferase involved in cell wall biosynthesis